MTVNLEQCDLCSRKFHPERIERHQIVCAKAQQKQKEREQRIAKKMKKNDKQDQPQTQSNWRDQHTKFQEMIQYNRKIKEMESRGEDPRTLKAPEPQVDPSYVHCEHCQRNFAPHVAAKHIPKCKDTFAKPKPPRQVLGDLRKTQLNSASTTATSQAERKSTIRKQLSDSSNQFRPKSLQKMMKTTDQLKQPTPASDTKTWTNVNFMDCQSRAIAISNTECPHCYRKFVPRAAERHIPICEKLTQKQLLCMKNNPRKSVPSKQIQLPPLQAQKKQAQFSLKEAVGSFCTGCGNKFALNHKYCGGCGQKRES